MKRSILFLLGTGVLMALILWGALTVLNPKVEADPATVDAANQLYVAGHFDEAARIYEQEVARGVQDSAVYYNLGNAYFQQGDMSRAVVNLQRAAQLDPRDADIQANLALAREQTTELFTTEPTGPVAFLARLTDWLTLNETAILVIGLWFLMGFLLLSLREVASPKTKKALQYVLGFVAVLFFLSGVSLASRTFLAQTQPAGVVVTPSVAISTITDLIRGWAA
jgi:tetratricopeptide (TPR) repeat protein